MPTAAHPAASGAPLHTRRPRVLFVGHTSYTLPLSPSLRRKWEAVGRRLDHRVLATGSGSDPRFVLVRGPRMPVVRGAAFYAALPVAAAREIRRFRPDVVVAQSPYEAFAILPALRAAPARPRLIVEVHGDWRTAARLYGPPSRRAAARLADAAAAAALRRADGTRALTGYTARLAEEATGREPLGVFPTYFDLESFTAAPPVPLPEAPTAIWVGVLQPYKDPEGFAEAWLRVARQLPAARLIMVGEGPLIEPVRRLQAQLGERVRHLPRLSPPELRAAYDEATLLALPSRSEGMGRVIIEAFTRARPVVASRVGGIPDLVVDGRNGRLAPPGDPAAFAAALLEVLGDPALAQRMSAAAVADAEGLRWTAERYADELAATVERALSGAS